MHLLVRKGLSAMFASLELNVLMTDIYCPQEHTSPGIIIAMLPPAETFTWVLPRRRFQPSSL